jgi:hypothetical protein
VLLGVAVIAFAGPKDNGKRDPADRRAPVWTIPFGIETRSLAFSPDDKYLAVAFNDHLLVVDVQAPETNIRHLDLPGACGMDLAWNESGDALLTCGRIVRLADGMTCGASYGISNTFWLDSQHVVRSTGEILDLSCRPVGQWCLQAGWSIAGVAASKGWVLLERYVPEYTEGKAPALTCEYSIADRNSHRTLTGWPTRNSPFGHTTLAVGAEALCFDDGGLHCRAINGGRGIHVSGQVRGFNLKQPALSSPRIMAEKWAYDRGPSWAFPLTPLTMWVPEDPPLVLRQRAIVDLRSGKLIASWKPGIQHSTNPSGQDWPYRCALSASGQLFAESGDGTLELYRLAP